MNVDTGGPIRGLVGRWLTYLQAIQSIVQMVSIEVTAASTLSVALQNAGHGDLVIYVFAVAAVGTPLSAYLYVKLGFYARKNRENQDMGNNWAGPNSRIQAELNARAIAAALQGGPLDDDQREAAAVESDETFLQRRDGVEIDE